MPRIARATFGGLCYHVLNRGNQRATVYHDSTDYERFVALMGRACEREPMRVLGYCLMPNHFHLVLWPPADESITRWMHWLMTTHVRGHADRHATCGRIWQGRFKTFPVQDDRHLVIVRRYVERNLVRARLVDRAEDWRWGSARWWKNRSRPRWLIEGPTPVPTGWLRFVNEPRSDSELGAVRRSVQRSSPFGERGWFQRVSRRASRSGRMEAAGTFLNSE